MTASPARATFEKLLREFHRLPHVQPREPTLLEITGFQHQEVLASNVLAFYLDPAKPHGLGSTVLATLLDLVAHPDAERIQHADVRTEVYTDQGKRLDLVIDARTVVVGIENKIYHEAVNPFEEYRRYLEQISGGRLWYGILLTLRPIAPSPAFYGFQPISYPQLFQALLQRIGGTLLSAREPYLTFLRDFIRTISGLSRETSMDAATLSFFRDNQVDIERLLEGIDQLRTEMRQKLQTLKSLIDTSVCAFPITPGFWRSQTMLSDILVYEVNASSSVAVNLIIHVKPTGWMINLHNAKGDQPSHRAALEDFLRMRGIEMRPRNFPNVWRLGYGSDSLAYDAPLSQVQEEVQGFLRQISQSPDRE